MKPIYWVLIVVAVLVIGFLLYNSYQNRKKAEAEALNQQLNQQISNNPENSSQVAQILNALFPFFNTYAESSGFGK